MGASQRTCICMAPHGKRRRLRCVPRDSSCGSPTQRTVANYYMQRCPREKGRQTVRCGACVVQCLLLTPSFVRSGKDSCERASLVPYGTAEFAVLCWHCRLSFVWSRTSTTARQALNFNSVRSTGPIFFEHSPLLRRAATCCHFIWHVFCTFAMGATPS